MSPRHILPALVAAAALTAACEGGGGDPQSGGDAGVPCTTGETWCVGTTFVECLSGVSLQRERRTECARTGLVCDETLACVTCRPGAVGCAGADVGVCRADGSGFDATATCDVAAGQGCRAGGCTDLCEAAEDERAYAGCEFRALDLDNGIDGPLEAGAQQYALVVSNPSPAPAEVVVEANDAAVGAPLAVREVARQTIAPGALALFELEARTLDGASAPDRNDGTHSALTSKAYRVRSSFPVIAYQFNPLEPNGTFSADASLLLPTSAWGDRYTLVAWPQTIGPYFPRRLLAQFRSFLTVAAAATSTHVKVTLGPDALRVAACDAFPESYGGDVLEVDLGPFDVLNVETDAWGADLAGTIVEATEDVAVFVGSEAANVPFTDDPLVTIRAADHLEEQLVPDRALGLEFVLAPLPSRTRAVSEAFAPSDVSPVTAVEEPDWVRVTNAGSASATVTTGLPAPFASTTLAPGETWTLRVDAPTTLVSTQPVSVLQAVAGQQLTGIPNGYPGGDPAITLVPPVWLYRDQHVFLVPDHHAFDFVVVTAPVGAAVALDGEPLDERCEARGVGADWTVYTCQLGFPLLSSTAPRVRPGVQDDGVHRVEATAPVGLVVYGFDEYISYAYPGGLNTVPLE